MTGRRQGAALGLCGVLTFWCLAVVPVQAEPERSAPEAEAALARIFAEQAVRGTFVLRDGKTGALTVHDAGRAATRFIPASTFKIPNSLIGLETGAVKGVDEILPYGGKPQPFKAWEHDMPLREAIRLSAVPIYQELARRVGLARMQEWVKRLGYGNAEIGAVVDRFWLVGPLKISAIEQTEFLARLANGELPGISAQHHAAVQEITLLESGDGYVLHGKTGLVFDTDPQLGWWVGWVERPGQPAVTFALNIDLPGKEKDVGKRIPLGKACLRALGVLPP